MPNAWVEFVRQYAKDNNLSYGCAISEASPAYRKMKQEAKLPKTPTKKRITIKPKIEKSKADARESVENALSYLEKMKKIEDDKLDQSDFYKYQCLAWFENSNDISRSNKYKKLQKRIKEECSKLTYPKTNYDCEEIFIDMRDYFRKDLEYFTEKVFPKILKRIKKPNYKIPTEANKNKIKKNDEDFIKEMAKNNDLSIKQAVGQLKTIFY